MPAEPAFGRGGYCMMGAVMQYRGLAFDFPTITGEDFI